MIKPTSKQNIIEKMEELKRELNKQEDIVFVCDGKEKVGMSCLSSSINVLFNF